MQQQKKDEEEACERSLKDSAAAARKQAGVTREVPTAHAHHAAGDLKDQKEAEKLAREADALLERTKAEHKEMEKKLADSKQDSERAEVIKQEATKRLEDLAERAR
eukprot:13070614-Heterocapsa_arctica.AAC.1